MMEEFKKLLVSKAKSQEGKPKDEGKLRAKASMAKELSDMLGSDLTDDIKGGMSRVTVVSDSSDSESEDESESEDSYSEEADSAEEIKMKIEDLKRQLEDLEKDKK